MTCHVLALEHIDRTQVALAGGKGANLGALTRLQGIHVPAGFCVTTDAFRQAVEQASLDPLLDQLAALSPDDLDGARTACEKIRRALEAVVMPDDLVAQISRAVAELDADAAYAVRSSATAEDLPGTSFAGQHDSYLDVVGTTALLAHIRRCWASLFTERAVTYRLRNGFDHRRALMAVVVQRMVSPHVSGVLFTADPITSNRTVTSIEAAPGLGEALVAGLVNADSYKVRDGVVVERAVASEQRSVRTTPGGGTPAVPLHGADRDQPALTDEQAVELAGLGRRIEAHLGSPQDIEWCLDDDGFHIVQARPITTLFPIPEAGDDDNHVYLSVGHQQMMTDALRPLGMSVWQRTTSRPMAEAGGRLFVDVTPVLASPAARPGFLAMIGGSDPLIRDALETVLARDDFLPAVPDDGPAPPPVAPAPRTPPEPTVVAGLIERNLSSTETLRRTIQGLSGTALLRFIEADFAVLQGILFDPQGMQVIMAALEAAAWLNQHLHEWLGEKGAGDTLTLSVPNNVTSEMGLALLDVADAVRPHPAVVDLLRDATDGSFLDELAGVAGGQDAHDAIRAFLERFGMRGVGEIDITRPRWSEQPSALVPLILTNVASFEPGEAVRRFERGRQDAAAKEAEILDRLRALPDGDDKASRTKDMIDRLRSLIGYREHPKYAMVSRYFVYKRALLGEADRLVRTGVLDEEEDIFFLRLDELHDVVSTNEVDRDLIARRRDEHRSHQALTPPRVLTSEGEAIAGAYRRDDVPAGALLGLAVSAGTVEGRARVVHDMAGADLLPGDILVTAHTDPSWSPLFVTAKGLVTEVGGLMTHGSVVAREYGLPAVVGVHDATRRIRDGQHIRVNGTDGYIEILTAEAS